MFEQFFYKTSLNISRILSKTLHEFGERLRKSQIKKKYFKSLQEGIILMN